MRYCLLLCVLLCACGRDAPFDPLSPNKTDRAIEEALAGHTAYLFTGNDEIVYWRFHPDGRYEFRQTGRSQYRFYESGPRWWIRDGHLFLERTDGSRWYDSESIDLPLHPYFVQMTMVGPSIAEAHWVIIHGHEYRMVDDDTWRDILASLHGEE